MFQKYIFIFLFFIFGVRSFDTVILIPDLCGKTSGKSVGQLILSHQKLVDDVYNYTEATSCKYTMMSSTDDEKIIFGFGTGYGEDNRISSDIGCREANVSLYDSDGSVLLSEACGKLSDTLYVSSSNQLTLEVNSLGGEHILIGFKAHFTSFSTNCSEDKFRCANGRCVDVGGRCDGQLVNNCGDFSDNWPGPPATCTSEPKTTLSPIYTPANSPNDLSWLGWLAAGVGGLGLMVYLKCIRVVYLVWPCCNCPYPFCRKCFTKSKSSETGILKDLRNPGLNSTVRKGPLMNYGINCSDSEKEPTSIQNSFIFKNNKISGIDPKNDFLPEIGSLRREAHIERFSSLRSFPPKITREKHIFSL